MKVIHRFIKRYSKEQCKALRKLGISVEMDKMEAVEIEESDPRWIDIEKLIKKYGFPLLSRAEFSAEECMESKWIEFGSKWYHLYPEPSLDASYKQETYDDSKYCEECGIGLRQVAPFRIKTPPRWGKRHMFILNWVYDEIFVKPDTWESVFKPFDVGIREVLDVKGKIIDSVVQLDIPVSNSKLIINAAHITKCAECDKERWTGDSLNYLPFLDEEPEPHIFKVDLWQGVSANSQRPIIISRELYKKIASTKLKEGSFRPQAS